MFKNFCAKGKTMQAQLRWFLFLAFIISFSSLASTQVLPTIPPEKVAMVLDQHIHYYEAGRGPVVILLHGLGANARIWRNNMAVLAEHYHVYTLDQIGFGHSDKPFLDYKIQSFVEFLQGFVESQSIKKAALVGNSLGGWIAADFTVQHPDLVSRLVLVNSAGLPFGEQPVSNLNPSSLAGTRKVLEASFYNKQAVTDELVREVFTNHLRDNDGYTIQRIVAGVSEDQFEDAKLGYIHVPTLIIWGRNDELIPLAKGEQFRQSISGSKMAVIDQCGHLPEVEKPAEFNQVLMEFLGQE
jgi:pimeloyl-ACP methyl ester carboxylesterase